MTCFQNNISPDVMKLIGVWWMVKGLGLTGVTIEEVIWTAVAHCTELHLSDTFLNQLFLGQWIHLGLPQSFQKERVAHLQLHLLSDHYDTHPLT